MPATAGHNAPLSHRLRVFTAGQKRRVTPAIKHQMRRRSAVEPVIGHIKSENRMGRNHLAHAQGEAINATLAAAGYNFSLLLRWLKEFWCLMIVALYIRPNKLAA
jgi:transposase, IS5 family